MFSQSYRPGTLAARGFSPQALARAAARASSTYRSTHGARTGPWRDRRGFDSIVQTVSGMALALSGDGGKPQLLPVSAIDYVSGYLMAFGAMVALARRAREGGSWMVRVALARVGQVDRRPRSVVPDGVWRGVPEDLPPEELAPLLAEMDAPDGRIRYLRPVVQLSETPPRWSRPPVPLDYHRPEWPPRG